MQARNGNGSQAHRQTVLDQYEGVEDNDSEYGHLVQHLIEQDLDHRDTNQWTGVFARDSVGTLQVPNKLIGPDLIYDRSVRACF